MDPLLKDVIKLGHECLDKLWAEFVAARPADWRSDPTFAEEQLDHLYTFLNHIKRAELCLSAFAEACDHIPEIESAEDPASMAALGREIDEFIAAVPQRLEDFIAGKEA